MACAQRGSTNVPPSATLRSDERDAAYQIAAARCDRLESASCQSDESYPSREACINEKVQETAAEVPFHHCEERVDTKRLERCVEELRKQPCGSGVRVEACATDNLCPSFATQEGA